MSISIKERGEPSEDFFRVRKLHKAIETIVQELENKATTTPRGLNLCAPCSFENEGDAKSFVEIISSGNYPLQVAEGGVTTKFDYVGRRRKNIITGYSVAVRYVKPQKNGRNVQ